MREKAFRNFFQVLVVCCFSFFYASAQEVVETTLAQVLKAAPAQILQAKNAAVSLADVKNDVSCLSAASNLDAKKSCFRKMFSKLPDMQTIVENLIGSTEKVGLVSHLAQLIDVAKPYAAKVQEIGGKIDDFLIALGAVNLLFLGTEPTPSAPAGAATSAPAEQLPAPEPIAEISGQLEI